MNNNLRLINFLGRNINSFVRRASFHLFFSALLFCCGAASGAAQRRDHLTEMEVEIVRDVQQVDRRMEVFIKAIDRRLLVLNEDRTQTKQVEKDLDRWGELPTGTRLQLLTDIEEILEEAVSKIDDVAARDGKNELFPVAVNVLADGATKLLPQLKAQFDKSVDEKEKGALIGAIDFCNQIIEASAKVPRLTDKERKKIRSRKDKEAQDN